MKFVQPEPLPQSCFVISTVLFERHELEVLPLLIKEYNFWMSPESGQVAPCPAFRVEQVLSFPGCGQVEAVPSRESVSGLGRLIHDLIQDLIVLLG